MNKQKGFDILFLLEVLEYYIEKKRCQRNHGRSSLKNYQNSKFPINWIAGIAIMALIILGALIILEIRRKRK